MKPFFTAFKNYSPTGELLSLLEGATLLDSRMVDTAQKVVQLTLSLPSPAPKDLIYQAEEELRELYSLGMVRILTKYPADSFRSDYVGQVIREAERTGAVMRGFFDECDLLVEERHVTIGIPYSTGAVSMQQSSNTAGLVAAILKSEFDTEFTVSIKQNEKEQATFEAFTSLIENQLNNEMEESRKAAAALARQREEEEAAAAPAPIVASVFGEEIASGGAVESGEDGIYKFGYATFDTKDMEMLVGKKVAMPPVPIACMTKEGERGTVCGQLVSFEVKENRRSKDKSTLIMDITDRAASITVRVSLPTADAEKISGIISKSTMKIFRGINNVANIYDVHIAAVGQMTRDDFTGEMFLDSRAVGRIAEVERMDNAPKKRVELHMHTNLSAMDSLIFPEQAVALAKKWGWTALPVTDHGNVQAFPMMMEAAGDEMKVLYGMEAYLVDDSARAVFGSGGESFAADQFVIFDIETTGLSPTNNRITEIGGVIVQGGEVVGTFSTFADPGCPIPANITEITGITDDMVAGAPSQGDAVRAFLDFAGGRTLVAHNANFDMGFIRHVCTTNAIPLENSYVDTVAISRYINPDLRRHRLDVLCEHYGVKNAGHHRAVNDCEALAEIFAKMTAKLAEEGVQNIAQLNEAMANRANPKQLSTNHAVIFAKNRAGLKKLYELVSQSHLDYYYRSPRIPKSLLSDCRDDLLLGSACEAGELYQAILDNKPHSELQEIAAYYDYLEIHPLANNAFLVANGKVANQEELQEHNRLICRLGEETGRPVVAVTDAHYLRAEDDIYRKILLSGMKFSGAGDDHELYLRTTEEMLAEFAYLGEEKAYEVVVENTNTIADSIEQLRPIPKGTYTASLEGADAELMELCRTKALATYSMDGETLPEEVSSRLSRELDNIIKHGFGTLYLSAQKLVEYSEKHGYLVGSRGSVGSSFAATMSGISEVNPLPPHYRCPACRYSNFSEKTWEGGSYAGSRIMNGLDLPNADCPKCGGALVGDGHDIPFETFMGFNCDKTPDIDLNFSGEIQGQVHKYTEELFGSANVFRAGTIGTLASKTAYGFVKKFLDDRGVNVNRAEINRLVSGCVGTKRTTGQHPGGMMVVPGDMSIHDFSPVQRPADDVGSDVKTTHFAFTYLHDTILKLDILGHDIPTKYKRMEEYTGVAIADVPMNDPEVYKLLTSTQPLGLKEGATSQNVGTLGLPELGTSFVMQMLEDARPQNFADLVQISGLSHGTDVWIGNAAGLIRDGTCTISEVIGTRDDIMLTLIRYGLPADNAFAIMESVRKGKGLKPEWEEEMRSCGVPEWYMESCRKIKYMFPKAHAAAYVMSAVRLGWYKIYHPTQFYAAYFSVDSGGFDATIVAGGRGRVKAEIAMTNTKIGEKKHTAKDKETLDCMLLVEESMARGIKFLPPCLQKSQATAFLVEDGAVRMPLQALPGLGENVAKSIVTEREKEPFANQLELQKRAGINKTVMEVLAAAGMLEGMAETNQITMF